MQDLNILDMILDEYRLDYGDDADKHKYFTVLNLKITTSNKIY